MSLTYRSYSKLFPVFYYWKKKKVKNVLDLVITWQLAWLDKGDNENAGWADELSSTLFFCGSIQFAYCIYKKCSMLAQCLAYFGFCCIIFVRRFLLAIILTVSFISSLRVCFIFFFNVPNRLILLTSSGPISSERQRERRQINLPELRKQTNNRTKNQHVTEKVWSFVVFPQFELCCDVHASDCANVEKCVHYYLYCVFPCK